MNSIVEKVKRMRHIILALSFLLGISPAFTGRASEIITGPGSVDVLVLLDVSSSADQALLDAVKMFCDFVQNCDAVSETELITFDTKPYKVELQELPEITLGTNRYTSIRRTFDEVQIQINNLQYYDCVKKKIIFIFSDLYSSRDSEGGEYTEKTLKEDQEAVADYLEEWEEYIEAGWLEVSFLTWENVLQKKGELGFAAELPETESTGMNVWEIACDEAYARTLKLDCVAAFYQSLMDKESLQWKDMGTTGKRNAQLCEDIRNDERIVVLLEYADGKEEKNVDILLDENMVEAQILWESEKEQLLEIKNPADGELEISMPYQECRGSILEIPHIPFEVSLTPSENVEQGEEVTIRFDPGVSDTDIRTWQLQLDVKVTIQEEEESLQEFIKDEGFYQSIVSCDKTGNYVFDIYMNGKPIKTYYKRVGPPAGWETGSSSGDEETVKEAALTEVMKENAGEEQQDEVGMPWPKFIIIAFIAIAVVMMAEACKP